MRQLAAYVAASSTELDRARSAMRALEALGIEITLDWTERWRPTVSMTREERMRAALADLAAIEGADAVLVLAPSVRSDALVELGVALTLRDQREESIGYDRPLVVVSGRLRDRGIFASLYDEHDTDADALAAIERWAREVRG